MEVMLRHQHDVTGQSLDVVLTELQLLRVMRMMMAVPKVSRRREMGTCCVVRSTLRLF